MECNMCGGQAYLLGTLGNVEHYRCRACGWDRAVMAEAEADEPEAESSALPVLRDALGAVAFAALLYVNVVMACVI